MKLGPGANFIELLSREFCLANIFIKHFKTDYQPKYINFTCKFGWYPRKSAKQIFLVSNFLCLAALWNWALAWRRSKQGYPSHEIAVKETTSSKRQRRQRDNVVTIRGRFHGANVIAEQYKTDYRSVLDVFELYNVLFVKILIVFFSWICYQP